MDRSLGFGSMSGDWTPISDSLSLRLRLFGLTSPPTITRRPIMQKVRSCAFPEGHSASTACRHTISGSFHSPSRGSFRLSLMVLVHYRSPGSIQAWKMVLPDSHKVTRASWYSGYRRGFGLFVYGAIPRCGPTFQTVRLRPRLPYGGPTTPRRNSPRFGLFRFRSPLLTESRLISFPRGT